MTQITVYVLICGKMKAEKSIWKAFLHLTASGRVAWRNIYPFEPQQLTETVNQLNADLSDYFKLLQDIQSFSHHVSGFITPIANTNLNNLLSRPLSDMEVLFYTRELLFTNQSQADFKKWIAKIKEREPITPPDLHMLLALITYRSGDVERSLRMLEREYAAEIPDNALIFSSPSQYQSRKRQQADVSCLLFESDLSINK